MMPGQLIVITLKLNEIFLREWRKCIFVGSKCTFINISTVLVDGASHWKWLKSFSFENGTNVSASSEKYGFASVMYSCFFLYNNEKLLI